MHDQLTNDGLVTLVDERITDLRNEAAAERLAHDMPAAERPRGGLRVVVGRALVGLGVALEGPAARTDDRIRMPADEPAVARAA
jgi:hypothetical protein